MNLWELVIVALENVRSNKLRSFLTTLGIVIGIAAVITVVAIGQGGRAVLMQEMEKFGTNIFRIYVSWEMDSQSSGGDIQLSDITLIKQNIPEVKYLAPVTYGGQMRLQGDKGRVSVQIIATSSDFANIRNLQINKGRFFNAEDDAVSRRVIVLDEDTSRKLFGPADAVGKRVLFNSNSALVVGVLKKEVSALGFNSGSTCYVPWSTFKSTYQWVTIHEIEGSAASKEQVTTAIARSQKLLERRHNAPNRYASNNMESEMQSANTVTGIMTLIISCIAGISLLVGGIGVMNIMLVSVSERTREIGIRMALGARRKDILIQFLIESVVLCLLGGIIGTILGYGGASLVAYFAKWPPLVSWVTVMIAFLFSAVVGLFFGIYPANKASKLDPIEALRRE